MLKKISLVAVFLAVTAVSLHAAPLMSHNSRRKPKSLIVVGNYKTPRLMAATILGLTNQPYIVVTNDGRYFAFLPPKVKYEIPADKIDVYINRLNIKRIVIIGDERFVTRAQEEQLRKVNLMRIPMIRIYGGDWGRIAEELDDLLNIGNLAREFRRNYYDLSMSDVRLRDPASEPEQKNPAKSGEETPVDSDEVPASEPEVM